MNDQIGTVQTLTVIRKIDTGYVLGVDQNEVLLHHNETHTPLEVDEQIEVFLYEDKQRRVVATTTIPTIQISTYDWAKVVEVVPRLGVFVNIGIAKEFLVSLDDLPSFRSVWPKEGDKLYVTLGKDRFGRLLAIPATDNIMMSRRQAAPEVLLNENISGYVYHTSREGSAIFTADHYRGFIHHTERESEPRLGQFVEGRVIAVKEDGTINMSLKPLKQDRIADDANTIFQFLEAHDGVIHFSDKSDPADIEATFNFSKSAFKRAIGRLMKERKVIQKDGKTYLVTKAER